MSIIGKIIGKMDVSNLRFKKPSKSEHKPSLLKEVMDLSLIHISEPTRH